MPKNTTRDITLHYDVTGAGETTLIFVHGMCGGGWVWQDQVTRLASRFRCITYDRRGHSRSGGRADEQSMAGHAEDLATLIESLDLVRPVITGSSGGGVVTVELLHRRPELVRGALVSEPPLFSIDARAGAELIASVRGPVGKAISEHGPEAAVEAFLDVVCPGLWPRLDEERQQAYRDNAAVLLPSLETGPTVSLAEVANVQVPTWVVMGAMSPPTMQRLARLLAKTLARSRLIELAHAGHATYVDAPEAFARTVVSFAEALRE